MRISGRTILVTGGAGLIGSHLADALVALGCRVKVLDSLESYTHPAGISEWIPKEVEFLSGNILDREALEIALRDVDLVFHQAAFTGFHPEAAPYLEMNAIGTARIFDVVAEKRFPVQKIVLASSLSVYGEGKYKCEYPAMRSLERLKRHEWEPICTVCAQSLQWQPTDEESSKAPFTPYAVSKYAAEMLALSMGKRLGIPTVALRYAVTYGPRQSVFNPYSTVITTFATLLVNGRSPVLYEDGRQRRDWTFVEDIVQANLLVMKDERSDYRSFNVGTGEATTVREVAELLANAIGCSVEPIARGEFRSGDIRNLVLDISGLRSLGFEPRVSLEAGIRRFVGWFRTLGKVEQHYSILEEHMRRTGELLS
ncbi:MAG: NAD-dependent epimerase/dehydratase family protein [Deltaproteobacteria bacterium]|nr:NAD-dependent epimerase/dehydratase family protein [Deltaproteobacteria bacterium]